MVLYGTALYVWPRWVFGKHVCCTFWVNVDLIRTMGLKSQCVSPFCKQHASVRFYDISLMSLNYNFRHLARFSAFRHWNFQFLFCCFLWTTSQIKIWYAQEPLHILTWICWYVYFVIHNSMETFVFLRKKAKFISCPVLIGH